MKRGFSITTALLVALLLGVLVMVGKAVNPPPARDEHDHGDEQAPAQAAKPPSKEQQAAMQKEQTAKMQAEMKKHYPPPPPSGKAVARPKDTMDPSAWQEHEMGAVTPKPDPAPVMGTPQIQKAMDPSAPKMDAPK